MNKQFFLISIMLSLPLLGCGQSNRTHKERTGDLIGLVDVTGDTAYRVELFGLSEAERILGEPAYLTDSASYGNGEASNYKCAYTARATEAKTGKTGVIYFLDERYFTLSAAQKRYSFIKTSNKGHGIQELQDLGDEAYFHTDGQNFYFIMVRKGDRVFNMKVNKITSNTSLDEFNRVARKIAAAM